MCSAAARAFALLAATTLLPQRAQATRPDSASRLKARHHVVDRLAERRAGASLASVERTSSSAELSPLPFGVDQQDRAHALLGKPLQLFQEDPPQQQKPQEEQQPQEGHKRPEVPEQTVPDASALHDPAPLDPIPPLVQEDLPQQQQQPQEEHEQPEVPEQTVPDANALHNADAAPLDPIPPLVQEDLPQQQQHPQEQQQQQPEVPGQTMPDDASSPQTVEPARVDPVSLPVLESALDFDGFLEEVKIVEDHMNAATDKADQALTYTHKMRAEPGAAIVNATQKIDEMGTKVVHALAAGYDAVRAKEAEHFATVWVNDQSDTKTPAAT